MKRLLLLLTLFCFSLNLEAQAPPQKMSYQFVVRNAQNQLIPNNAVGMRISILQGSPTGPAVYVETHVPTTNGNGTATIEIGNGTVVSGVFSNIDWSTGVYFVQTEIDPAGAASYSVTGVSQLLTVPYAFYAETAKTVENFSYNEQDSIFLNSAAGGITAADTAAWNQDLVDDADNDPTNELQTLSVVGDSIFLSGGGGSISFSDGDTSLWKEDPFGIHYNEGNVGIGPSSDTLSALSISRDIPTGAGRYMFSLRNTSASSGSNASLKLSAGNGTDVTQLTHWSPSYTAISGLANYSGLIGTGSGLALISNGVTKFMNGSSNPTELMRIDANGNVGIGTPAPTGKLTINDGAVHSKSSVSYASFWENYDDSGNLRSNMVFTYEPLATHFDINTHPPVTATKSRIRLFRNTNANVIKSLTIYKGDGTANKSAEIGADGVNSYFQNHGGNFGIGTNAPAYTLHVDGTAGKPGGGSWTAASDQRLKQNIRNYEAGLSDLLQIRPVRFQYNEKAGFKTDKEYIGVIAQELQEVAPYMVGSFEKDGETYLDVDNSAMTYMLINAVKEQQEEIESKESRIESQEDKINELEARLEKLEQIVNELTKE